MDRAPVFYCSCGAIVAPPNKTALALIEAAGACHKCRLANTVEFLRQNNVELLDDVLRFTEGYEGFRLRPKETPLYSYLIGFELDISEETEQSAAEMLQMA